MLLLLPYGHVHLVTHITITLHLFDADLSFIFLFPLYEDHTGQNIVGGVLDILENWYLDQDKIVAVTTERV